MSTCTEIQVLLDRHLALELPPEQEREVRKHLEDCGACRAVVARRDPVAAFAFRLAAASVGADESFVAEVMAGIHQHRIEHRLHRRGRRWLAAAAAVVLAVLGGFLVLRGDVETVAQRAAEQAAPPAAEAAFVEVEGDGVRVYQFAGPNQEGVQVALIIDPRLEL